MKDQIGKRIAYIDVMKGLGILLVCLGHSTSALINPLNTVILSFHMPLFFFVSGLLFGSGTKKTIGQFLLKKARVLLIPQLVLAFITILTDVVLFFADKFVFHRESSPIDFVSPFFNWFLIVLFVAELILWLLEKLFSGKKIFKILLIVILFVVFCFCDYNSLYIQQILVATVFLLVGQLLKPVLSGYIDHFEYKGIFVILVPLVVVLSALNLPIAMYMNQYGNKVLFLITALLGVFTVFDLSIYLQSSKLLLFFGENSIIVYVTHFNLQKLLRMVFAKVGVSVNSENLIGIMLLFIATMIFEVLIVLIVNRYFYFLFGKRKKKYIFEVVE